ncbi:MAG: sensor histidine kinase, partial [Croceimicrobium sp.]
MKLIDDVEFLLVFGTFMAGILIAFIILIVVLYRRSQLKMQLERQNFQQSLLETEVEIQEQTLHNISRDLHDNFGQIASLIKINLNLLSKDLPELDRNRISESKDLLSKLIGDIRVLSSSLAAENLEKQGLAKRIESDLDRVKRTGAI